MGHVLPGAMFILAGVWWAYNIIFRFLLAHKNAAYSNRPGLRYHNSLTFPWGKSGLPVEPCVIIALTSAGIVAETVTGFKDGVFVHLGNGQHILMYFFFCMMGLVELLRYFSWPIPPSTEYISAILAIGVEGLLFSWHLHGRTPMDVQLHQLLLYAIYASIFAAATEMCLKREPLAALARAFFTCLQGSWFFQAGTILYPPGAWPSWDEESHGQMMVVTMLFVIHMAAIFLFLGFLGVGIHFRVRSMSKPLVERYLKEIGEGNMGISNYHKLDENDNMDDQLLTANEMHPYTDAEDDFEI